MYTITFPIPAFQVDATHISIPTGLARDVLTQWKYQHQLRLICPTASTPTQISDPYVIDLATYPGLSFRFLPWNGGRSQWFLNIGKIRRILIEEACQASVWHTCCSGYPWDLTTVSYQVGRRYAQGLRVLCLDSDPAAMLEASGGLKWVQGKIARAGLEHRIADADAVLMLGRGVEQNYGRFTNRKIISDAVWLKADDLATPEEVMDKFRTDDMNPIRMILPSRFMAWKGVDDVIQALSKIGDQLPPWQLDIIGEGPEKQRLMALASPLPQIRFLEPIPYDEKFFALLRHYHVAIVPTRAVETQRITYDTLASGCVLIHSGTVTLEDALKDLSLRWSFAPGQVDSIAETLQAAFEQRDRWSKVGLESIAFARGRTIDKMHQQRADFIRFCREYISL